MGLQILLVTLNLLLKVFWKKKHACSVEHIFRKTLLRKCWSMKALDQVLDTSDDVKTYPEGPRTYLKKTQISKFSSNNSSSMIVYDDRLDYRLRLSSQIIV